MFARRDFPCYIIRFERHQGAGALRLHKTHDFWLNIGPNRTEHKCCVLFSVSNDTIRQCCCHCYQAIVRFRFSFHNLINHTISASFCAHFVEKHAEKRNCQSITSRRNLSHVLPGVCVSAIHVSSTYFHIFYLHGQITE